MVDLMERADICGARIDGAMPKCDLLRSSMLNSDHDPEQRMRVRERAPMNAETESSQDHDV
jgi:hypothetical protein